MEGKVFLIQPGTLVSFQFNGYSGQIQEFKGLIDSLSSDSIYLHENRILKPGNFNLAAKDITGFRAYSLGRNFGKLALTLALTGSDLAFYYGVVASSLATGPAILIGMGTGLITYGIIRIIFPDKIKRTTSSGWSFKIIEKPN